jgi:hypothetical protein
MTEAIHVKGSHPRGRVNRVVHGELDERKHRTPGCGRLRTVGTEDILGHAVGTLGLTIRLRVVSRRHVEARTE